ncbi:MAG: heat-inducible transcriptional repressor HrcA [Piscirickettsiaceae bacterium]|nr:MAG: heat-inducible transcriptional repressor HrcA [Piscirickettsiaceae bacterium]
MTSTLPDLNERSQQLLKLLVEQYIEDGQPVASKLLSQNRDLGLSPATIRHVMADLEEMGLIHSPHTSAGRVPTNIGYRFFVDSLLTIKKIETAELEKFKQDVRQEPQNNQIVATASQLLSGISHLAGVVSLPKRESASFRQIEFMPLSKGRILVILVTNNQEVHNRVINTQKDYSASDLQQAANYLNDIFSGQTLRQISKIIAHEMNETREKMNQLMVDAISLAHQSLDSDKLADDIILSGETNLMDFHELSNKDSLRHLFDAFSQKQGIMHLLDRCMDAEGVQIYIGDESGYQAFDGCSLVTAPYTVDNQTIGVLGVIGPTRMAYDKVIPLVDITAKFLGDALKS